MEALSAAAAQAAALSSAAEVPRPVHSAPPGAPEGGALAPFGSSKSSVFTTSGMQVGVVPDAVVDSPRPLDDHEVVLHVGDSAFSVRRGMFISHPETMLGALFSGRHDTTRRVFRFDGQNALAFAAILKFYQGSELSWDEPPAGISERVWLAALDFWGIFPQLPPSIAAEIFDGFHEHVALLVDAMHTARPLLLDRLKAGYLPCVRFVSPYYPGQPVEETVSLRDFLAGWVGEHPGATCADALTAAIERPGAWCVSDGYARTVVRGVERFLAVGYAELHNTSGSSSSSSSSTGATGGSGSAGKQQPAAPAASLVHAGLGRSAGPMVGLLPRPTGDTSVPADGTGRSTVSGVSGAGACAGASTGAGAVAPAPPAGRFGPQLPTTPISQERLMACNGAAAVIAASTAAAIYAASTLITYSPIAQHMVRRDLAREGLRLRVSTTLWPEDVSAADMDSSGWLNPYEDHPTAPGATIVKLWSSRLRGSTNLEPAVWKVALHEADRRRLAEAKLVARRGVTYVLLDVTPF